MFRIRPLLSKVNISIIHFIPNRSMWTMECIDK